MSSKLQLPALAIFDMDGLIFDTERLFMTTKDGVMKEYGYTQQKDDYIHTLEPAVNNYWIFCTDFTGTITRQKRSVRNAVHWSLKRSAVTVLPQNRESRNFSHGSQIIIFHAAWHLPQSMTLSWNICVWQTSTTILHLLLAVIRYRVPNQTRIFFWQHVSGRASDRKLHLCWKTPKTVF